MNVYVGVGGEVVNELTTISLFMSAMTAKIQIDQYNFHMGVR